MSNRKPYFHDAIILGKTGAMIYVVDEAGNKLSQGHHEVTWHGHDDFEGRTGASDHTFTVDTDQIDPWDQRFTRKIELQDIIDHAADERIRALALYLSKYDRIPTTEQTTLGARKNES